MNEPNVRDRYSKRAYRPDRFERFTSRAFDALDRPIVVLGLMVIVVIGIYTIRALVGR